MKIHLPILWFAIFSSLPPGALAATRGARILGELVLVGKNNSPASAFPLKECQADCGGDWDCEVSTLAP
jgi:hypothetical protein